MRRKVAYRVSTGLLAALSVFAAFTYLLGSPQTAAFIQSVFDSQSSGE
jgi:hypothetical protein